MGTNYIIVFLKSIVVLFAACASAGAFAGATTSTSYVGIIAPLSIVKGQDMNFGTIIPGGTAGTVMLSPSAGTVTHAGGVFATSGATSYAQFAVDAKGATQVAINWNGTITLSSPGGQTMTVNLITYSTNATVIGGVSYVPSNNILLINFGGTLNVGASQPAGAYTGTFTVTAAFQ